VAVAVRFLLLATAMVGSGVLALPTWACRYNVRDLGFVDLADDRYALHLLVDDTVSPAEVARLTALAETILEDSNVTVETVNRDRQSDHVAWRYLAGAADRRLPAGVLMHADHGGFELWPSEAEPTWTREASERIESVVTSPLRAQLLEQLVSAYAVVLMIEGRDGAANRQARKFIEDAINQIEAGLTTLPKVIARPPVVLTCAQSTFAREAVLLSSLGLDPTRGEAAQVAVIYGRARRIGPLLRGKELTTARLVDLLSVIGADCECGLDLTQTRGTPLPVRWGTALQAQAARALGFDPESPMVKAEASRILAGQGTGTRRATGQYREVSLGEDNPSAPPGLPAAPRGTEPPPRGPQSGARDPVVGSPLVGSLVWTLVGLTGVVLVAGGLLWNRYRRSQQEDPDA
jgi:hypothetical protein